ncbi:MAG: exonuclease SbcCD subunit D [Bacteroidetes bacterium QS_8_68_15]|nr:MAG: exonuclease SbcCD subunit D [Bacteroidetes bacterium QS_8_68_15]
MKLLHTADIHLGITTFGRVDPETGLNTRILDFKRSFEFLVERGLSEGIDCFLFAGDAYRTADPTPTQQKVFAECLRPVAEAGLPIVMVVGNHDHPVTFGKASALDIFGHLDGDVHVFDQPESAVIETPAGPLQLLALPWPIRSKILSKDEHQGKSPKALREFIEDRYTNFIDRHAAELDPSLPAVLAGHFSVQGAEMAGSERTSLIAHEPKFTAGDLSVPPIDYAALGHIHQYQNRAPEDAGGPPVIYPSSIERVSFKEWDERKGFVLVDIDAADAETSDEKTTQFAFVETPARPFVALRIDAREAEDPTEAILDEIEEQDVADAIVRVRYHIEEAQIADVDARRLREALSEAHAVAALERDVDPAERERRTVVTRESTLEDALRQYVAQREELASIEDDLVDAALDLEGEHDADRRG